MGREAKCKAETRRLRALVKSGAMTARDAGEAYRQFRRPWRTQGRTGIDWQPRPHTYGVLR